MQADLFAPERTLDPRRSVSPGSGHDLDLPDATVSLVTDFFKPAESDVLLDELTNRVHWRQDTLRLYGRTVNVPRLQAWYGDPGRVYAYSGLVMRPEPWLPVLRAIKQRVEDCLGSTFNSVLLNLYRDGRDSVGWHSDDEPELGTEPLIASVSFGGARRLLFRHKRRPLRTEVALGHGSLLVMSSATQRFWLHQVPKTRQAVAPRVNLTFRRII